MPTTYEPIATTTLGSAASEIIFSSIASSWTDLMVVLIATHSTGGSSARMQFNGDTGTNYSYTRLSGDGATATSGRGTSTAFIIINNQLGTTNPSLIRINIFSYAGSTNKTVLTESAEDQNGTGNVARVVGLWRNTAAITSLRLFPGSANFNAGTTATLYGIKNA